MNYNIEDIDFSQITSKEFENLCYDMLVKYDFQNLIWREGGADSGRDIQGLFTFKNTIQNKETSWFFECKHYKKGVPPEDLSSKISWADAELPNSLVFFISSYITNGARTWLDKIIPQKSYDIIVIEGEDLKNRLTNYPDLIERYFSSNRFDFMFKTLKDYKFKYKINPSYDVLAEIIHNIDLHKLDHNDIGFILFGFYSQYDLFETRNEYYGDFDDTITDRLLAHLKNAISNNNELKSTTPYLNNYDVLAGTGIFDEFEWLDNEEVKEYRFQYYDLHLNPDKGRKHWKTGKYLFILMEDTAIELFYIDSTEIRIFKNLKPYEIPKLSLINSEGFSDLYEQYRKKISI